MHIECIVTDNVGPVHKFISGVAADNVGPEHTMQIECIDTDNVGPVHLDYCTDKCCRS